MSREGYKTPQAGICNNAEDGEHEDEKKPAGVFFPRWLIAVIAGPIVSGGFAACLYVTSSVAAQKNLLDQQISTNHDNNKEHEKNQAIQSEKLNQIRDKIDSNNSLVIQFMTGLNKRVDRLEDKILFKSQDKGTDFMLDLEPPGFNKK